MHHLLTFLGTNQYHQCIYISDILECRTAFSSLAVHAFIQEQYDQGIQTRVSVFATSTSKRKNGEAFRAAWSEKVDLKWVEIPETADEESFWTIFKSINEAAEIGETIWLDITHSFRYLPMLAYSVLDYMQTVRKIPVGGIYYGAAEVLGPFPDWPKKTEERRVPLRELSSFLKVNQWATALRDFNELGSAIAIRKLTDDKALPLKKSSKGKDRQARALEKLGRALEAWSQQVATCRGAAIQNSDIGETIHECIETIDADCLPPLAREFENLFAVFAPIKKGAIQNIFFAAKWSEEKRLIQQSWTLLLEGIIGFYTEKWSQTLDRIIPLALSDSKKNDTARKTVFVQRRDFVSQLFNVTSQNIPSEQWKSPIGDNLEVAKTLQQEIPHELSKVYTKTSARRNDINHAGFTATAAPYEKIDDVLEQLEIVRRIAPEAFPSSVSNPREL